LYSILKYKIMSDITKKKVLFIDRDGTIIAEPPVTFQVDTLEQMEFLPGVLRNLHFIRQKLDFEWAMVTNQDGLGTEVYLQENFDVVQAKFLQTLTNEDITFDKIFIDKSFPEANLATRKPGIAMLTEYFSEAYDLAGSYVIGDRPTDVELAKNLGCKAIFISDDTEILKEKNLSEFCAFQTTSWDHITEFLFAGERTATVKRATKETDILIELNLDGSGKCNINTGLKFFDHMLEQIGKHSGSDLTINVKGDLEVDEHHTIEDTAIALGEAFYKALGNKRGIERYGFYLPMDDCLCSVALDFGGRAWLVYDAEFKREYIGDLPTEMILHFFKSFSDAARMNLNIKAEGDNEHHKIEGIFKALAKSIKMAVKRDIYQYELPSTKGML
jgi:imidazoleglycerol-phosphate dehydratase / histidinol-phosphatase